MRTLGKAHQKPNETVDVHLFLDLLAEYLLELDVDRFVRLLVRFAERPEHVASLIGTSNPPH
jgi:hypothetical protein